MREIRFDQCSTVTRVCVMPDCARRLSVLAAHVLNAIAVQNTDGSSKPAVMSAVTRRERVDLLLVHMPSNLLVPKLPSRWGPRICVPKVFLPASCGEVSGGEMPPGDTPPSRSVPGGTRRRIR